MTIRWSSCITICSRSNLARCRTASTWCRSARPRFAAPGGDVTIVATGWMVPRSLAAAKKLAEEGIQAEVIDPRTVAPLDLETILKSVAKTGRLVLVDQAPRHATVAGIIAGDVAEHGFSSLKAPIVQVTARDATVPYSEPLEAYVIPDEERIIAAVRKVLQGRR